MLAGLLSVCGLAPAAPPDPGHPPRPSSAVNFGADVIYHIVTDRFVDGDRTNNPAPPQFSADCQLTDLYCGGDWAGIVQVIRGGYFKDLGITALLISVPYENTMALFDETRSSYHGYWPRDMKRTNPAFGSFADFRQLVDVAHQHGLKLMIDVITNQGSPGLDGRPDHGDGGALYDDGKLIDSFATDSQGLFNHHSQSDYSSLEDMVYRSLYDLADLNQQHPVIDRYLKEMIRLWLDTGIDGLRVDTVKHVPLGWQRTWMETIYRHRPVFTAGEWYTGRDEVNPQSFLFANESGMSVLDFPMSQRLRQVFRYLEKDMLALDQTVADTARAYRRPIDQVTFIDNHDMARISLSNSAEHHRLVEQGLAFVLTSRGVPMIFYGTEHYTVGQGHAPINRPMMRSFDRFTPAFRLISRLAELRRSNPAIQYGSQIKRWVNADAYVYERRFAGNSVLVAINRHAKQAVQVSEASTSLACADGQAKRYDDLLAQRFGGSPIMVDCSGGIAPFTLSPGAIAVWAMRDERSEGAPALGHLGPPMAWPGTELTLSGVHFGSRPGVVWIGDSLVQAADVLSWGDTQIRLRLPALPAGRPEVRVGRSGQLSDPLAGLEVLGRSLVSLRVVIDEAKVAPGEAVYIESRPEDAHCNAAPQIWGPMYDQVVHRHPSRYFDISVAAGCRIGLRFFKKQADQAAPTWALGDAHVVSTPAGGTATTRLTLQGWNSREPSASGHD